MNWRIALAIVTVLVLLIGGYVLVKRLRKTETVSSPSPTAAATLAVSSSPTPTAAATKRFNSKNIANVASQLQFEAEIPRDWRAEAVPSIEAINLYDPSAAGASNLEKSQIFIRYFSAATFLTLRTVTIHSRTEQVINGRPAVRYEIEKRADVASFPDQPSWRNQHHVVTDIRVSQGSPSIFYVIAKRPDLDESIYQRFLQSL